MDPSKPIDVVAELLTYERVRGVIFDLDGTLIDSLRDIGEAMDHVLDGLGLERRSPAEYERFVGDGARLLVRRSLGARIDLEDEALAAFRARYFARLLVHTRPYAGVGELLASLAARATPTAVLSNKPHDATVKIVRALFPDHSFVAVIGQRDEAPRKPDPTSAFEIARAMRLPSSDIVLLGDTPVDVATARAAGMIPIGALWGMRSRQELETAGAAHLIETPAELASYLGG